MFYFKSNFKRYKATLNSLMKRKLQPILHQIQYFVTKLWALNCADSDQKDLQSMIELKNHYECVDENDDEYK